LKDDQHEGFLDAKNPRQMSQLFHSYIQHQVKCGGRIAHQERCHFSMGPLPQTSLGFRANPIRFPWTQFVKLLIPPKKSIFENSNIFYD